MTKAIPLKQWVHEESKRSGISPIKVYKHRLAGWYPALSVIKINSRVIFVERDETPPRIRLMQWVRQVAKQENVTQNAIYNRLRRGKYPNLKVHRVNSQVAFVEL